MAFLVKKLLSIIYVTRTNLFWEKEFAYYLQNMKLRAKLVDQFG